MLDVTFDLSASLSKAAQELAAFGKTGDLQERNSFGFTISDVFKQASGHDIGIDAMLHMLRELSKREPVMALHQLMAFSIHLSADENKNKVLPLIDELATPETIKALVKDYNKRFPSAYLMQGMAAVHVMENHVNLNAKTMKSADLDHMLRLAAHILDENNESPQMEKYRPQAVRIAMTILNGIRISPEDKRYAFFMLLPVVNEPVIRSINPDFIDEIMKPFAEKLLFGEQIGRHDIKGTYKSMVSWAGANSTFSQLMIDMLPRVLKHIKELPEEDQYWSNESKAAELAQEISTGISENAELKKLAFAHYEAYALTRLDKDTSYEDNKIDHAVSLLNLYDKKNKEREISLGELKTCRELILSTIDFAYANRSEGKAESVVRRALEKTGEYKQLIEIARAIFQRRIDASFKKEGASKIFKEIMNPYGNAESMYSNSGLRDGAAAGFFFDAVYKRLKNPANKLMMRAHGVAYLDNEQDKNTFLKQVKALGDSDPNAAWPIVKRALAQAYYYSQVRPVGLAVAAEALSGFLPHINQLTPDNKGELLLVVESTAVQILPDVNSLHKKIQIALDREKPKVTRSHPAFEVRL